MKYLIIMLTVLLSACQGRPGNDGKNGSNGMDGNNGQPGMDAISPSVVKFCPNVVDSYPSSFPEYGLCIDNKIYAIYNNAYLAYITPGVYTTTAGSNNCTFTVVADSCEIQ